MKPQYSAENGMLVAGNFWQVHPQTGKAWTKTSVTKFINAYLPPDNSPSLDALKTAAVTKIKQQAATRILALDWTLQRAEDRVSQAALGGTDQEATLEQAEAELLNVLNAREDIRQASNQAETSVMALEDVEAVKDFSWPKG
jgi:hypothetical protein